MSYQEETIASFLGDQNVMRALSKLEQLDFQRNPIPLAVYPTVHLTREDERLLSEVLGWLSLSGNTEAKKVALQIATALPLVSDESYAKTTAYVALARLTNFAAIPLVAGARDVDLGLFGALEGIAYKAIYSEDILGQEYQLSRFQKDLADSIRNSHIISTSAPTSAGKSFILQRILLEEVIDDSQGEIAIYVVPTRSLMRQVTLDFLRLLRFSGEHRIRVLNSPEFERRHDNGYIFVLTQERLQILMLENSQQTGAAVKMVVFDEAQGIGDGSRGVILEDVINQISEYWPKTKLVFSSPLIQNPETFIGFDRRKKHRASVRTTDDLAVRQLVLKVNISSKSQDLAVVDLNGKVLASKQIMPPSSMSVVEVLISSFLATWNGQQALLYCNDPSTAAQVMRSLYLSGMFQKLEDPELQDFAEFISYYVHPNYELVHMIKSGIAFHFGTLPTGIRSGIEDLMAAGKLKVVAATSTLLEGLNMPTKCVYLYKPARGRGNFFRPHEFWNLAGRAGRLGHDLVGTVFCINIESWKENPLDKPKLACVISTAERTMRDNASDFYQKITAFYDRQSPKLTEEYEHLLSILVRNKSNGVSLLESSYITEHNMEEAIRIDAKVQQMVDEFLPPINLLQKSRGLAPQRLNNLWRYFERFRNSNQLVPKFPLEKDSQDRLTVIVNALNVEFGRGYTNKQVQKLVVVASKWMAGRRLSEIITYGVTSSGPDKGTTDRISNEVEFLERKVRYTLAKDLSVYLDVLDQFFEGELHVSSPAILKAFTSYMEYGACKQVPLMLMSMGFSRAAALELDQMVPETVNSEHLVQRIRELEETVSSLQIPKFLRREILQMSEYLIR